MTRPEITDWVEVPRQHREAAGNLAEAIALLGIASELVNRRAFQDRMALVIEELRREGAALDPQCRQRDSGGARCERRDGHPPGCACPRASAAHDEHHRRTGKVRGRAL